MNQEELSKNLEDYFSALDELRGSYDHVISSYKEGDMTENIYITELLDLRDRFTDIHAAAGPLRASLIEAQNNTIDSHRSAYRAQLMLAEIRAWEKENPAKKMTGVIHSTLSLNTYDDVRYRDFLKLQSKLKALKGRVDDSFQDIENFINSTAARLSKTWVRKED